VTQIVPAKIDSLQLFSIPLHSLPCRFGSMSFAGSSGCCHFVHLGLHEHREACRREARRSRRSVRHERSGSVGFFWRNVLRGRDVLLNAPECPAAAAYNFWQQSTRDHLVMANRRISGVR
jgi:hypothetical protein